MAYGSDNLSTTGSVSGSKSSGRESSGNHNTSSMNPGSSVPPSTNLPPHVSNGVIRLHLDPATGRITAVSAADGSWAMAFTQDIMAYNSSTGEEDNNHITDNDYDVHRDEGHGVNNGGVSSSGDTQQKLLQYGEHQKAEELQRLGVDEVGGVSGASKSQQQQQQQQGSNMRQSSTPGGGNDGDVNDPTQQQQQQPKQQQQCGIGHGVRSCDSTGRGERGARNGGQSSGAYIFRPSAFAPVGEAFAFFASFALSIILNDIE